MKETRVDNGRSTVEKRERERKGASEANGVNGRKSETEGQREVLVFGTNRSKEATILYTRGR